MWWNRFGHYTEDSEEMVTINENLNQNVKEGGVENYNDIKIIGLLLVLIFIFYKTFTYLKKFINKKINNAVATAQN